ncbi:Hypothetical predicted protein, partial [Paramuricea clavata]
MRPDQHKKKKNSDYKKKHGIPSEKGEKHDKKGSTGAHRSDEKPASDVSKSGLETDGTDRDVGESSISHERGKFSRRKIESNLDRYKEDDFDDDCEPSNASPAVSSVPIGADFQSLLDNATSASGSSHFRFKSEKEWENLSTDEANNKGVLAFVKGVLAFENQVLAFENQVLAFGKGVLAFENGVLAFENGVLAFENGVLAFENQVLPFEKGVLAF